MSNEQLVTRIKAGENEAENMLKLWQQNTGIIGKIAMKYQSYAEIEDLKQEGYIGLCAAVHHYDVSQGTPFINYAAFWIKQTMRRYIANCGSSVRIPVNARSEVLQYKKIASEYRKQYGTEPTDKEMRVFLGVSKEKLDTIKKNALKVKIRSLSEPVGDDEDILLSDTLASDQDIEEDVIKKLDVESMKKALWAAVDNLPDNFSEAIRYRYQGNMTLKEVGQCMGVSTEYARQVEAKALRKLRIPSKCKSFKGYYEQYIAAGQVRHVGIETFNRTWMSSVELEALRNLEYK